MPICIDYDEIHAVAMLKALKNWPSILGEEIIEVEKPIPDEELSSMQLEIKKMSQFDPMSDMDDHLYSYSDWECKIVQETLKEVDKMTDLQVRDESFVRSVIPKVVEYRKIENCVWDPKKRDTVIQLKFELPDMADTRLVMAPFNEVYPHLKVFLRHLGKPFQGAQMTVTNVDCVIPYLSKTKYFVMTIWVGPIGKKITETGTGYRSEHFPGTGPKAPDHANRLLIRGNLRGEELLNAYKDFIDIYDHLENAQDYQGLVPILLRNRDFLSLS
jgi:hypothetical protein